MMIARWTIEARFGYKPQVIESMKKWSDEVGREIGWPPDRMRVYTGSLGAPESTVQSEIEIDSLEELDEAWGKLATLESHKQWSKDLEPYVVSGTPHWEVLRVVE
ncbi:hypothetical protein CAI21_18895 [Alkalilimnicola ehrlichii]|uniref:NIPSNAP domain-containing protein n=1 Tax=Alkalilimnicola ehrlichii TaxID=351052 RepID=A0A3E0WKP8_9GAMM|nr:hypothetical protein [Alkalilimnicola ehrlichii]RFA25592.1 hypothetical protein CAI21_18895 [Alkalilimnicola ehrlichii]RFA32721.1 hypothetical protein CAL65_19160 [Alkalilimnicola ehrlichii]